MAYISRRDFLGYTSLAAAGIGTLANEAFAQSAQTKQSVNNASRKFLDVLVDNLHTGKVRVTADGGYEVTNERIEGANRYITAIYHTIKGPNKQESLEVEVSDYSSDHLSREYKFENAGLQDLPTVVIETGAEAKQVRFNIKTLPKQLQDAHKKAYEAALNELIKYLSSAPAKQK